MDLFIWETFSRKQKQQEGEEQEEDAVSNPSDWSLSPKKKKKHVIVTPAPATTTKEDKEKEEQERSEKKKRVTQEKEEGLNPSDRSPKKKKKRRAESKDELFRLGSTILGDPVPYVLYDRDHNPSESTYHRLVGFCNKALEKYNKDNNHNCLYEYASLLKALNKGAGSSLNYEIIFDASLPHEDGFRFETFEASIRTGINVQKGVEGYGQVVSRVGKFTGGVDKYTAPDYLPRFW